MNLLSHGAWNAGRLPTGWNECLGIESIPKKKHHLHLREGNHEGKEGCVILHVGLCQSRLQDFGMMGQHEIHACL